MGNISSNQFKEVNAGQMYNYREGDNRTYIEKMEDMSKLNKFIIKTLNEKYYVINDESNNNKILLKRALCTRQSQMPISLPYVELPTIETTPAATTSDVSTSAPTITTSGTTTSLEQFTEPSTTTTSVPNDITTTSAPSDITTTTANLEPELVIKDYTIMVPIYYPKGDGNTIRDNNNNDDSSVQYIDKDKNNLEPNQTLFNRGINIGGRQYGATKDGTVNQSGLGCNVFYLGRDDNKFDLKSGMCKTVLDYRRNLGKDWNEIELCDEVTDNRTNDCNGRDRLSGNDFYINTFRDCNCVLTSLSEKLKTDQNIIINAANREYYAQNLDNRCNKKEFTFTTGNKIQALCSNTVVVQDSNIQGNIKDSIVDQKCINTINTTIEQEQEQEQETTEPEVTTTEINEVVEEQEEEIKELKNELKSIQKIGIGIGVGLFVIAVSVSVVVLKRNKNN